MKSYAQHVVIFALFAAAAAAPSKVLMGPQPFAKARDSNLLIVGGEEATPYSHPWQVMIQMISSLGSYNLCSGTIVGASKVVTSGQCAKVDWSLLQIVAGSHDPHNYTEPHRQVKQVWLKVAHPQYNEETIDYDFGVYHIVGTFTFNEYVQPLPLASADAVPVGTCETAGWGRVTEAEAESPVLMRRDVPIIPREQCAEIWGRTGFNVTENMLCGGAEVGTGACDGDAGNPLVCQGEFGKYLAGTGSFLQLPCGSAGYPDGFSNIAAGRKWIDIV